MRPKNIFHTKGNPLPLKKEQLDYIEKTVFRDTKEAGKAQLAIGKAFDDRIGIINMVDVENTIKLVLELVKALDDKIVRSFTEI